MDGAPCLCLFTVALIYVCLIMVFEDFCVHLWQIFNEQNIMKSYLSIFLSIKDTLTLFWRLFVSNLTTNFCHTSINISTTSLSSPATLMLIVSYHVFKTILSWGSSTPKHVALSSWISLSVATHPLFIADKWRHLTTLDSNSRSGWKE